MNTEGKNFLYKDETHKIIGCGFEVLNTLGHGLLEKPYETTDGVNYEYRKVNHG